MCREVRHGKNEFAGPGHCSRLSGAGGEASRRENGAGVCQQRIRELRREPDQEEYARVDVPRRKPEGGHRG